MLVFAGTGIAALVGLQKMTMAVGAATRITGINCRASQEFCPGLRRPAIVLQGSELGMDVVQISGAAQMATLVAAKVVALGGNSAGAVSPLKVIRDYAVLECRRAIDPAALDVTGGGAVPRDGTVANRQRAAVGDAAATAEGFTFRAIPADRTVDDRQRAGAIDAGAKGVVGTY